MHVAFYLPGLNRAIKHLWVKVGSRQGDKFEGNDFSVPDDWCHRDDKQNWKVLTISSFCISQSASLPSTDSFREVRPRQNTPHEKCLELDTNKNDIFHWLKINLQAFPYVGLIAEGQSNLLCLHSKSAALCLQVFWVFCLVVCFLQSHISFNLWLAY